MKKLLLTAGILLTGLGAAAQTAAELKPACDSLRVLLKERTGVASVLGIDRVDRHGNTLDICFNNALSDYPWRESDREWIRTTLRSLLPDGYRHCRIGDITCRKCSLDDLVSPDLTYDGQPVLDRFRIADPRGTQAPLVEEMEAMRFDEGLTGRHIALWQSHGRYYEAATDRWEWQRAPMLRTVEDMYTQSYVLPFLIPMLENAGAYVMTPRERDTQVHEVVCDNDPAFKGPRRGLLRREGDYKETGKWQDAGIGFADPQETYLYGENPFTMGSVRMTGVTTGKKLATARWTPSVPERGEYAVYVSYKSLPNSTDAARYTVRHLGGVSHFIVNQRIGGGTWIYLGTFSFAPGGEHYVLLDNGVPEGREAAKGSVVTADAVRFGGGMGKVARGLSPETAETSGLPSFTEGAMYWMQWAGIDTTVWAQDWTTDYTKDYAGRGAWVTHMAGGSRAVPEGEGRGIPFDASLAFHSDAGTFLGDTIVGTLSIYTLLCDDSDRLPDGTSRLSCRELADYVQSQIVRDVRAGFAPEWTRRQLWDRSYSESRTTSVPGLLLELLSHQNLADMKYGLDPAFRFEVSRAIYKGFLKFLSNRYGCPYAVQPLPVHGMAVDFTDDTYGTAELSWLPTEDPLEETASPTGYILRVRVDDGVFNSGTAITPVLAGNGRLATRIRLEPGHLYSFQVIAYNGGGKSFPSETLSIGAPAGAAEKVLVVNNFDRISAPAWFDTDQYAGFDDGLDSGVPYLHEINYIGSQYLFRRDLPWMDDDSPGFGASRASEAGKLVPGNTFDFPAVHGRAVMSAGYAFASCSAAAFASERWLRRGFFAADLICGKQVTTRMGSGAVPDRYQVYPDTLQTALRDFTEAGGHVLVSGAHIGTDVWDQVYPVTPDSAYVARTKAFCQEVLGYKWLTNYATETETVFPYRNDRIYLSGAITFHRLPNGETYSAEAPDGLVPASDAAVTFLRYSDTQVAAGICHEGDGYRTVCIGFPIEVMVSDQARGGLLASVLGYFAGR